MAEGVGFVPKITIFQAHSVAICHSSSLLFIDGFTDTQRK